MEILSANGIVVLANKNKIYWFQLYYIIILYNNHFYMAYSWHIMSIKFYFLFFLFLFRNGLRYQIILLHFRLSWKKYNVRVCETLFCGNPRVTTNLKLADFFFVFSIFFSFSRFYIMFRIVYVWLCWFWLRQRGTFETHRQFAKE